MLPESERAAILAELSDAEIESLLHDWLFWARPNQIAPPGDWRVWLILAGRGFGKTRCGAEWVRQQVKSFALVNLIGATADDARDIMIDGESGILAICPKDERPVYRKSDRQLIWPNGAKSLVFTADEPERLRGKQHMKIWADELCAWRYPASWDQAMFGLRLGSNPQAVVTTTPKPTALLKELMQSPTTIITRGSTYENASNLAPAFMEQIISKYEGTRLGRQELKAEILEDREGALWKRALIDAHRVIRYPELSRIVVAIDPEATCNESSAETGIIVAGVAHLGKVSHAYVLNDCSVRETPNAWAAAGVTAYHKFHADRIIGEVNNGGDMIEAIIKTIDPNVPYKAVRATRGKQTRAEPISALYEQGRVHHVGVFPSLEDQMCDWVPTDAVSPDRLDALVWALTELMLNTNVPFIG